MAYDWFVGRDDDRGRRPFEGRGDGGATRAAADARTDVVMAGRRMMARCGSVRGLVRRVARRAVMRGMRRGRGGGRDEH